MTVAKYKFTKEAMKPFNKISGIYALLYNDQVIYVGQSKTIGIRLKVHRRENQFEQILKRVIEEQGKMNRCKQLAMYDFINKHREEIEFVILKETEELDKYEEEFITKFKPIYNYKGVDIPY